MSSSPQSQPGSVSQDAPTRKVSADAQSAETRPPRPSSRPYEVELPLPQQIRHFTVLRPIGRGGMGVVLSAYDVELDRKVAIKLMHSSQGGDTEGRARLQREAQAMARLTHPNIARVYEAGQHEGRVYIVMEYIQGETLRAWLRRGQPWREVLAVMLQAGHGLAAAHAVGLVHRDFKPDNVMVGDDGFVRVLDFGLARAVIDGYVAGPGSVDRRLVVSITQSHSSLSDQLTEAGTLVGTPAYMSPEQLGLMSVGVESDQFSFCVALFEGLYGARPFKARTVDDLLAQIEELMASEPPRGSKVPARLWPIVLRGLSVLPEDRWPSMQALLAELAREPGKRTRQWFTAAALAAATASLGYGVAAPEANPCKSAASKFAGIWDDARKVEVREAFRATGVERADDIADRVELRLDDYVGRWVTSHTHACEATYVRGEQSATLLDRRMECLQLRRAEVDALVQLFVTADAAALDRAIQTADGLSRLDRCADAEALTSAVPPPEDPAVVQRLAELRDRLARLSVRGALLRESDSTRRQLDELLGEAKELGYLPLYAEVLFRRGFHREYDGEMVEAEKELLDAYFVAGAVNHIEAQADIAVELLFVTGYELGRFDIAMLWDRHAGMLMGRLGPRPKLEYQRHASLGGVLERHGKLAEARQHLERALAVAEADQGPDSITATTAALNLANVVMALGDAAEAERVYRRVLAAYIKEFGPENVYVGHALNNLGLAVERRGDLQQARELSLRALEVFEKSFGPEHVVLGSTLGNLGNIALAERELTAAREYFDRSLAVQEKALGPDDISLLDAIAGLAELAAVEQRQGDAEALATRAIGIHERAGGPAPPPMIQTHAVLGDIAFARDDLAAARRGYQQALELSERIHGPDHGSAVRARGGLARVALAENEPQQALSHVHRALAIFEAHPGPVHVRAELRFTLAEALHRTGDPRAEETARQALADYTTAGQPFARERSEVTAWIARR